MKIMFPALNQGIAMLQSCFFGSMNDFYNSAALKWLLEIVGLG
jgi:hypothetical protein